MSWQFRTGLVDEVRAGLESRLYHCIGELQLLVGMDTRWDRSEVFAELLRLARERDVPLMVHTEYASIKPTVEMCRANLDNRFLLAHAGAILPPRMVVQILNACPIVHVDLAGRDPWHYVNNPAIDGQGSLLPGWRKLVISHALCWARVPCGRWTGASAGMKQTQVGSNWHVSWRFTDVGWRICQMMLHKRSAGRMPSVSFAWTELGNSSRLMFVK